MKTRLFGLVALVLLPCVFIGACSQSHTPFQDVGGTSLQVLNLSSQAIKVVVESENEISYGPNDGVIRPDRKLTFISVPGRFLPSQLISGVSIYSHPSGELLLQQNPTVDSLWSGPSLSQSIEYLRHEFVFEGL